MQKTQKSIAGNCHGLKKEVLGDKRIFGFSSAKTDNLHKDNFKYQNPNLSLETIERVEHSAHRSFFDAESLTELYMREPYIDIESIDMIEGNIDYIEKGNLVVRVMDKHNFYETEMLTEEDLRKSGVGLLTKLWICISKVVAE